MIITYQHNCQIQPALAHDCQNAIDDTWQELARLMHVHGRFVKGVSLEKAASTEIYAIDSSVRPVILLLSSMSVAGHLFCFVRIRYTVPTLLLTLSTTGKPPPYYYTVVCTESCQEATYMVRQAHMCKLWLCVQQHYATLFMQAKDPCHTQANALNSLYSASAAQETQTSLHNLIRHSDDQTRWHCNQASML